MVNPIMMVTPDHGAIQIYLTRTRRSSNRYHTCYKQA
jgi:hypothetical protein